MDINASLRALDVPIKERNRVPRNDEKREQVPPKNIFKAVTRLIPYLEYLVAMPKRADGSNPDV